MALVLLKAGAATDKRDVDGFLPLELAPDDKVRFCVLRPPHAPRCLFPLLPPWGEWRMTMERSFCVWS